MKLLAFWFLTLIFYKAMPVFLFDKDNTVISAALGATFAAAAIIAATYFSTLAYLHSQQDMKHPTPALTSAAFFIFSAAAAITVLGNYAIVYGFADELRRWAFGWRMQELLLSFAFIFGAPVLVFYFLLAAETYLSIPPTDRED